MYSTCCLCHWHAGDRVVILFVSCHLLSFNQDSPAFRECVLNKRKWSKLYDKSCRGERSVPIPEWCLTGMKVRDSAAALMEAALREGTRHRVVLSSGFLCQARALKTFGSLIFPALCSYLQRSVTSLPHLSSFPNCSPPRESSFVARIPAGFHL